MRSRHPEIKCLMLTSYSDDEALFEAIMAGASGYLLKQIRGIDLVDAVRRVAAGQSLLDPSVTASVLERLRAGPRDRRATPAAHRAGAAHPRSDRRGSDEPPDRRACAPRREDGQELRVEPAVQARHGAPHAGGRLRGRAAPSTRLIAQGVGVGTRHTATVPPSERDSIVNVPPSASERVARLRSPLPRGALGSNPTPSSVTVSTTAPPDAST